MSMYLLQFLRINYKAKTNVHPLSFERLDSKYKIIIHNWNYNYLPIGTQQEDHTWKRSRTDQSVSYFQAQ
jgi:hypothetical protein